MPHTIKLVLDDVVKDFQQEEDQVMVGGGSIQEPGGGECLRRRKKMCENLCLFIVILSKLPSEL